MALTSLCAEVRIKTLMVDLGITCQHLSALDGYISNSRLSEALRGLRDLDHDDAARILALTKRLIELRDALVPLPLSWRKPTDVRWLLDNLTASPEEIQATISKLFR